MDCPSFSSSVISVFPPKLSIPCDEDDARFTASFAVSMANSPEVAAFFERFGFVVFQSVIEPELCFEMRQDMWRHLEDTNPGFSRSDSDTWGAWAGKSFGMPGKDPIFTKPILCIRQHPRVHTCFDAILRPRKLIVQEHDELAALKEEDDICCSHDRWILYRKTRGVGTERAERPNWRTKRNLHLDQNPWEFLADDPAVYQRVAALRYENLRDFVTENNEVACGMGRCVQGILNLRTNSPEDGGTLVVPGSHLTHAAYFSSKGCAGAVGPMQFKVPEWDPLQALAQRVTMREGSLLIWDQRLVHGSAPNDSESNRLGVPLRFFLRSAMTVERREARAAKVFAQLRNAGFLSEVSELGLRVFGLRDTAITMKGSADGLSSTISSTQNESSEHAKSVLDHQ